MLGLLGTITVVTALVGATPSVPTEVTVAPPGGALTAAPRTAEVGPSDHLIGGEVVTYVGRAYEAPFPDIRPIDYRNTAAFGYACAVTVTNISYSGAARCWFRPLSQRPLTEFGGYGSGQIGREYRVIVVPEGQYDFCMRASLERKDTGLVTTGPTVCKPLVH